MIAAKPNWGKHHSSEDKKKKWAAAKGQRQNPDSCANSTVRKAEASGLGSTGRGEECLLGQREGTKEEFSLRKSESWSL